MSVLLGCADTVAEAGELARALRADRDTTQLLQQAVAVRDHCHRCVGALDIDALVEVAMGLVGKPAARARAIGRLCAVEARDERIVAALDAALAAGRAVSPQVFAAQGFDGKALGEALTRERRRVMRERLSAALIGAAGWDG